MGQMCAAAEVREGAVAKGIVDVVLKKIEADLARIADYKAKVVLTSTFAAHVHPQRVHSPSKQV